MTEDNIEKRIRTGEIIDLLLTASNKYMVTLSSLLLNFVQFAYSPLNCHIKLNQCFRENLFPQLSYDLVESYGDHLRDQSFLRNLLQAGQMLYFQLLKEDSSIEGGGKHICITYVIH